MSKASKTRQILNDYCRDHFQTDFVSFVVYNTTLTAYFKDKTIERCFHAKIARTKISGTIEQRKFQIMEFAKKLIASNNEEKWKQAFVRNNLLLNRYLSDLDMLYQPIYFGQDWGHLRNGRLDEYRERDNKLLALIMTDKQIEKLWEGDYFESQETLKKALFD